MMPGDFKVPKFTRNTDIQSEQLSVQLVDDLRGFTALAGEFELFTESIDGCLFPSYRHDWISTLGSIYFPSSRYSPFFLLVRFDGVLIGAAMFRKVVRGRKPLEFRWLEFLGQHTGHGTLDNLTGDFLVAREELRAPVIESICRALKGPLRKCWDGMSLKRFCTFSESLAAFLRSFPNARTAQEEMPGFLVELGDEFEVTWEQFDAKARKNLRRAGRLLQTSGLPYTFETHETVDSRLLEEIAVLHSARQKKLLEVGRNDRDDLLANNEMRARVFELLESMAQAGKLRIYQMRIQRSLIAFTILFAGRDGANSWLVAFDESFARFSPSRLMFEYMYRQEVERYGTSRINLMLGYTPAKQDFSNKVYSSFTVEQFNEWSVVAYVRKQLLSTYRALAR